MWKTLGGGGGGFPHKQHSDALNEVNHQLVLDFQDTTTTISLIYKKVKRRHIGVKTWEVHPTHYLQETQIYNNLIMFNAMELQFFLSFLLGWCNNYFLSNLLVLMWKECNQDMMVTSTQVQNHDVCFEFGTHICQVHMPSQAKFFYSFCMQVNIIVRKLVFSGSSQVLVSILVENGTQLVPTVEYLMAMFWYLVLWPWFLL